MLAHELSHVAHRDVLVMTIASSAGIVAAMLTRSAQFGALGMGRSRNNNSSGMPAYLVALVVSLVVYAISFFLTRLLSRYRELCADRSGAYLTQKPGALASRAAEDHRRDGDHPVPRPARGERDERVLHRPGHQRRLASRPSPRPTRRWSSDSSSSPGSRPSSAVRRADAWVSGTPRGDAAPATAANLDSLFMVPSAAITLETAADLRPTGVGAVCFRAAEGAAFASTQADIVELLDADDGPDVEKTVDEYGFTWLVARQDDDVRALHRPAHRQHACWRSRASAPGCCARS